METKTLGGRTRNERGAGVVEFALILPLLMMLVFGVIQFGLLLNRQQALHAAAREGARVAALPATSLTDIENRVDEALAGIPLNGTPTVTITPNTTNPCQGRPGETVEVEVQVPTSIEIPVVGSKSVTLTGRGEFRCE